MVCLGCIGHSPSNLYLVRDRNLATTHRRECMRACVTEGVPEGVPEGVRGRLPARPLGGTLALFISSVLLDSGD